MSDLDTTMFDCDHPDCEDMISLSDGHRVVVLEATEEGQHAYQKAGDIHATPSLEVALDQLYGTGEVTLHEDCALDLGLVDGRDR